MLRNPRVGLVVMFTLGAVASLVWLSNSAGAGNAGSSEPQKRKKSQGSKAAAPVGEWPQWRGPNRNGISQETGLLKQWPKNGPELVWKITGLGQGFSSIAIADGRIFTMGTRGQDESVIALDVNGGKELWVTPIGEARSNGGGYPGPRATPTVDGDVLYALGIDGELLCLETATGKLRWKKDLSSDFGGKMMSGWGYSESPLVDGEKLLCSPGGDKGTVIALDKKTGELIWRSSQFTDPAAYASLMISEVGVRHYVQMTGKSVAGVAADDGRLLWRVERDGPTAAIPTPVVHNNLVYATSGYGAGCKLIELNAQNQSINASEVYSNKVMVNHHGGVVLLGDYLYGYSDGKGWVCQDFKDGKMVWNEKGKLGKGAVVYADGHLYARSEAGPVALIEATPRGYVEKGKFEQPDRSGQHAWPHPVVANGRLYLRDQDILLCYNVKADGRERAEAK